MEPRWSTVLCRGGMDLHVPLAKPHHQGSGNTHGGFLGLQRAVPNPHPSAASNLSQNTSSPTLSVKGMLQERARGRHH